MGLILLAKATTGGTDMVATIIQHYARHYSIVQIFSEILDAMVVLCGLYVFGLRAALYAIVAIFITTKVSDTLMEGFKFSKAAFIITDHYELVAKRILQELDRGVTGLLAKGMYSGADKCVLYCVVSQKEIVQVKEIVAETDPEASWLICRTPERCLARVFWNIRDDKGEMHKKCAFPLSFFAVLH